ncbi:MAG: tetratricopeptide repeat protein [Succinivibrionaceae bacterium]
MNKLYLTILLCVISSASLANESMINTTTQEYISIKSCMHDGVNPTLCANAFNNQSYTSFISIGNYYEKNKLDYNKAFLYYQKAASLGSQEAQYKIGIEYLKGYKVKKDIKKGIKWLVVSAKNKNIDSQYTLGNIYADGSYVPVNNKKALYWYKKAASNGHRSANYAYRNLETQLEETRNNQMTNTKDIKGNRLKISSNRGFLYHIASVLIGIMLLSCVFLLIRSFIKSSENIKSSKTVK